MRRIIPIAIIVGICAHWASAQTDSTNSAVTSAMPSPPDSSNAQPSEVSVFDMSLESLMNVEVSVGSNTKLKKSNIPVSLTTITEEDIRVSAARNIYDLLEIYVPGATWSTHGEGPKLGMKGITSDRNNKFLLRVNGVLMNQKAHVGVVSEMENWDLNDVQKIEIIRGPGSVTYGPGAIMGIVDITTKDASTTSGTNVFATHVGSYNSNGIGLSHTYKSDNFSLYAYGSRQQTAGYAPDAFAYAVPAGGAAGVFKGGYVGKDFGAGAAPVNTYFADFMNNPQYKAMLQGTYGKGWNFFARYTNSGSTLGGTSSQVKYQEGFLPVTYTATTVQVDDPADAGTKTIPVVSKINQAGGGPLLANDFMNGSQAGNKHFTASVNKNFEINDKLDITGRLTYDNEGQVRVKGPSTYSYDFNTLTNNNLNLQRASINNLRQWNHRFSEREITADVLGNYKFSDKVKAALGGTYTYNTWGAYWGDSDSKFRMGESNSAGGVPTNIISDTTSEAYVPGATASSTSTNTLAKKDAIFVGNGWSTSTISIYGDVKMDIHPMLTVLLSGRYDKDTYSRDLFSPRIALISEVNPKNVVKLVAQQSLRMNTATQLYLQHVGGTTSAPEKLQGLEMIYNRIQGKNMSINASVYYNTIDVLGWNAPKAQVARLGKQDLLGADIEVLYKGSKFTIGANHSFTKQLSWKLDDSVNAAGVSYSDYRNKIAYKDNYGNNRTVVVSGTGNSINNLPTNITKVFVNYSPFKMWTFHVDGRIFWDYQGGRDGLTALSNAAFSLNDSSSTMRGRIFDAVAEARNRKVYDMDIRTNVSISFHPTANVEFVAFCQNLTDFNRNKRYNIDAGNANYYPSRATFVVEPRSFGLKMKYTF